MRNLRGKTILVTGSGGFLGQHVVRLLEERGANVLRNSLDLTALDRGELRVSDVSRETLFADAEVDLVIHLAAAVAGIGPNRAHPYAFLEQNTLMTLGLVSLLRRLGNVPVVAAGSICAYPEEAPLPFNEKDFWRGKPDSNNLGYGLAKRMMAGALECAAHEFGLRYVHLIAANLYGPGDHFEDDGGHVIPSLIRRLHHALGRGDESFVVWGSGQATRDFLYVEDAARAYLAAAEHLLCGGKSLEANIGSGDEISIRRLVEILVDLTGFTGSVFYDTAKPDGQLRRRVDTNKADFFLEWASTTPIRQGLHKTMAWYLEQQP